MAELPNYETHHPAEMDYPEHEKTYVRFLAMTKWGIVVVAVIIIFMALFLL